MNDKEKTTIFEKIGFLTAKVYIIYSELCQLETDFKKETIEYQEKLEELNMAIHKENELYKNLSTDPIKMLDFVLDFNEKINAMAESTKEIIILDYEDENDRIMFRMFNKVYDKLFSDGTFTELVNDESINFEIIMQNIFIKDDYMSFLSMLEEQINNSENDDIRKELISLKYRACFFIPITEAQAINHEFSVPLYKFRSSYFIAKNGAIDYNYFLAHRNDYYLPEFEKLVDFLVDLNTRILSDKEKEYIVCAISSFISGLSMQVTESERIEIKNYLDYMVVGYKEEGIYSMSKDNLTEVHDILKVRRKTKIISIV